LQVERLGSPLIDLPPRIDKAPFAGDVIKTLGFGLDWSHQNAREAEAHDREYLEALREIISEAESRAAGAAFPERPRSG
jgi:hypothetical protein